VYLQRSGKLLNSNVFANGVVKMGFTRSTSLLTARESFSRGSNPLRDPDRRPCEHRESPPPDGPDPLNQAPPHAKKPRPPLGDRGFLYRHPRDLGGFMNWLPR